MSYRLNECEKDIRNCDSRIYYATKTENVTITDQLKIILLALDLSDDECTRMLRDVRKHDRQRDGSIVVTWGSLADKQTVHTLKVTKLPLFDNPWCPEKRLSIANNYSKDQHGESVRRKAVAEAMISSGKFTSIDMVGFDLISINGAEAVHYSKC